MYRARCVDDVTMTGFRYVWCPISAHDCRRLRKQSVTWVPVVFPVLVYTSTAKQYRHSREWLYLFYYVCLVMFGTYRFLLRRLIMPSNTCRAHVSVQSRIRYFMSPEVGFMYKFALWRTHFACVCICWSFFFFWCFNRHSLSFLLLSQICIYLQWSILRACCCCFCW